MLTDIDKETIKSGNVGQLTDLLTIWLAEAREFSESLKERER